MDDRQRSWRKIGLFFALTLALTAPFEAFVIQKGMPAPIGLMFGLMWSPATAALLTQLVFRDPLGALGFRAGPVRYLAAGYCVPLAYALPVYLLVWATGLGGFPDPAFVAKQGEGGILGAATSIATLHVLVGLPFALGEEIGWRGFLVPEMLRVLSVRKTAVIIGVVWAAWHAPVIALTDYNGGAPLPFTLACFTVTCTALSFVLAWLRVRSGSVWPAAVLHAAHNALIQEFLTPITTPTAATPWLLDEWGIGLPVTTSIAGWLAWRVLTKK